MSHQSSGRFFLTPHSAAILDDLFHRVNQSGSISLLYGTRGVGKSRLLQQFYEYRLNRKESVFVQFISDKLLLLDGKENVSTDDFFTRVITKLGSKSVLLLDHFDQAPSKLQHKFLKFWGEVAAFKDLSLVICIEQKSLHHLTEVYALQQLTIESVSLKPLTFQEQLEFLRTSCCPELRQVVKLSSELKKRLKLTNGLFSSLEVFRSQYKDEIRCQQMPVKGQGRLQKLLLVGLSSLLIIALTLFMVEKFDAENKVVTNTIVQGEQQKQLVDLTSNKLQVKPPGLPQNEAPQIFVDTLPEVEILTTEEDIMMIPADSFQKVEPSEVTVSNPQQFNSNEQPQQTVFQQRVNATRDWLESSQLTSASIQIMTISVDNNPQQSLSRYLNKLKSRQVDLEQIKIYPLLKRGREMYCVLYGKYESAEVAIKKIKLLPEILRANKPFVRTVKGVKDEVNWLK